MSCFFKGPYNIPAVSEVKGHAISNQEIRFVNDTVVIKLNFGSLNQFSGTKLNST